MTFKPKISKYAKNLYKRGNTKSKQPTQLQLLKKNVDLNRKRELYLKKEREKEEEERKRLMKQVKLSKMTEKIIRKKKKKKEYLGVVDGWKEHSEKYHKSKSPTTVHREEFQPHISEMSQELVSNREGDPFQRLYEEQQRKKIEMERLKKQIYNPVVHHTKSKRRGAKKNVFEDLYDDERHKKYLKKLENEKVKEEEKITFKPKLSEKSKKLAKRVKKKYVRKPLYSPKGIRQRRDKFNPYTPKRSEEQIDGIFDRLYDRNQSFLNKKSHTLEKKKKLLEHEKIKSCTWSPKISPGSRQIIKTKKRGLNYGIRKSRLKNNFLQGLSDNQGKNIISFQINDDFNMHNIKRSLDKKFKDEEDYGDPRIEDIEREINSAFADWEKLNQQFSN